MVRCRRPLYRLQNGTNHWKTNNIDGFTGKFIVLQVEEKVSGTRSTR
jgi:hypothetical protein